MSLSTPSGLVPPGVVLVGAAPSGPPPRLFAAEEALVQEAAAGRRQEFGWARACARAALARFGVPPAAIPRGGGGEPVWPAGFVGSISHCPELCVAAVARSSHFVAVGADVEPTGGPLMPGVSRAFTAPAERHWLAVTDLPDAERLLFSVKESAYKAWYSMTRRPLRLRDVAVRVDSTGGAFHLDLPYHTGPAARRMRAARGRFAVAGGHIWTALAVPAPGR